jgi:hypothetical protein
MPSSFEKNCENTFSVVGSGLSVRCSSADDLTRSGRGLRKIVYQLDQLSIMLEWEVYSHAPNPLSSSLKEQNCEDPSNSMQFD